MDDNRHNAQNREVLDPTPVALPVGYHAPETLEQTIHRLCNNRDAIKQSFGEKETFEEANDFGPEEEDDLHFVGPHEFLELQEEFIPEAQSAAEGGENPGGFLEPERTSATPEPNAPTAKVDQPQPSTVQ